MPVVVLGAGSIVYFGKKKATQIGLHKKYSWQNSPSQSNHQPPEGAVDPGECYYPLQNPTHEQGQLLRRECQDEKVGTNHGHTEQVDVVVKPNEPQDTSATVVVRHLKVPHHVD